MRWRRDERGAVLVVFALVLVAMMLMGALVLDLGQLRVDRRVNKNDADMAARAGVGRLQFGPWSGVCKARDYLVANAAEFSAFDAASERWSDGASSPLYKSTSPCPATLSGADAVACAPQAPATWAKLTATAGGGRFTVEIASGYSLPDPRFAEDGAQSGDVGATDQGSCDNLAVIISERQAPFFGQLAGLGDRTTRVRSVARLNAKETLDFVAALQLLEQHKCGALQTGGTNTRVIAQPYPDPVTPERGQPGIIQIDSADDAGSCAQPILNAQATSGGPSVVACSSVSSLPDCQRGSGSRPSRVGIYALNFTRPAGDIATAFPTTYGDTKAVATPRTGRRFADSRYRTKLVALDGDAKAVLTGSGGMPPGCSTVTANACTGNGLTWLVLQPTDCSNLGPFFGVAGRATAQNVWFNCDLNVNAPLSLSGADAYIVVTGSLQVSSTFTIADPRTVYIGGKATGNKIGSDVGSPGTGLSINVGSASTCTDRSGPGHVTKVVIGSGSLGVTSGASVHLCQTFVYLASGFDKLPASDGTPPCATPCSGYSGTISVGSGASVDWTAPNAVTGHLPDANDLAANPFEDLALWTEAGGNTNGLSGQSGTTLTGVYFMPNADSFNLAGGGSLPIRLSAQFIATSLKVTGGATVNLVPTPTDSIPTVVYSTLLVR